MAISTTSFTATRNGTDIASEFQIGSSAASHTSAVLADGDYSFAISIGDVAANGASASVSYVVDTAPPEIDLQASPSGPYVRTDVAVTFSVTDPHLDVVDSQVTYTDLVGVATTLPYASGTPLLAEGDYIVLVTASDLAGNTSGESVAFTIDKSAPQIGISGFADGDCGTSSVIPTITISDAHADSTQELIELNGVAFVSGTTVSADGRYRLFAAATDLAGNSAQVTQRFTIDTVVPTITVLGLFDGRHYASDRTPQIQLGDANVDSTTRVLTYTDLTGTVDVQDPWPGGTLSSEGDYQLELGVTDCAGNSETRVLSFVIDKTDPEFTITPPLNGFQSAVAVAPTIAVADLHLNGARTRLLVDGRLFTSGTSIDDEGLHVFEGHAYDLAGNEAVVEATFLIDMTAPWISVEPSDGSAIGVSDPEIVVTFEDSPLQLAPTGVDETTAELLIDGVVVVPDELTGTALRYRAEQLSDGAHTLDFSIADVVGNVASYAGTFEVLEPPHVEITSPADLSLTSMTPILVEGTATDNGGGAVTVTVAGQSAPVVGGQFTAQVTGEHLVHIVAVATDTSGASASDSIRVYVDARAPSVAVHWPPDGFVSTSPETVVTGYVNDFAPSGVGTLPSVTVNGIVAEVTGLSFAATGVPLAVGDNELIVVASDAVGNQVTAVVNVRHEAGSGLFGRVELVSGNDQYGATNTPLAQPLVVRLLDRVGQPAAGHEVVFEIRHNDGVLDGGVRALSVQSDANGLAQVGMTLGSRAGAGLDRVEAVATGFLGTATFIATGQPGPAVYIFLTEGNNQRGAVGMPLARPLRVRVTDAQFNPVVGEAVTFEVYAGGGRFETGTTTEVVTTDHDGRAGIGAVLGPESGSAVHRVRATVAGLQASPAIFRSTGLVPGPASATSISGTVVDNLDVPVPDATVSVPETSQETMTDADGRFVLTSVPVGELLVHVDPSTTTRQGTFSAMTMDVVTISGVENTLDRPIYIPKLDLAGAEYASEADSIELGVGYVPGFGMDVAAGSATFPDGSRSGELHVTAVQADRVPMEPSDGQQPRFIVTIQPPGVRFDPPAPIRFPNVEGHPPGRIVDLFSFDHDLAQFITIGPGSVSEDGLFIESDPGVGVVESGWHCGGNPVAPGSCCGSGGGAGGATCPECKVQTADPDSLCPEGDVLCTPVAGNPPCAGAVPSCDPGTATPGNCQNGTCVLPPGVPVCGGACACLPTPGEECKVPACDGNSCDPAGEDAIDGKPCGSPTGPFPAGECPYGCCLSGACDDQRQVAVAISSPEGALSLTPGVEITISATGSPGGGEYLWTAEGPVDVLCANCQSTTLIATGTGPVTLKQEYSYTDPDCGTVVACPLELEGKVLAIDLDADSNRNCSIDGLLGIDDDAEGTIEEEAAGALVLVNDDDDNGDGIVDLEQTGGGADDELVRLALSVVTADPDASTWSLTFGPRIRVWRENTRTTAIESGMDYAETDAPDEIFVEAIEESASPGDIEVTLTVTEGQSTTEDKVVLTALSLELFPPDEISPDPVAGQEPLALIGAVFGPVGNAEVLEAVEDQELTLSTSGGVVSFLGVVVFTPDHDGSAAFGFSPFTPTNHSRDMVYSIAAEFCDARREPVVGSSEASFKTVAGLPDRSKLTAQVDMNGTELVADGNSTAIVTVTLKDQYGNLVDDGTSVSWLARNQLGMFEAQGAGQFGDVTVNGQVTAHVVAPDMSARVDCEAGFQDACGGPGQSQPLELYVDAPGMTFGDVAVTVDSSPPPPPATPPDVVIPIGELSLSLTGPASMPFDSPTMQTVTLTTDAADDTPIYWMISNGWFETAQGKKRVLTTTVDQGSDQVAVSSERDAPLYTRVGPSVVTATIAGKMAVHQFEISPPSGLYVVVDHPVLSGDMTVDGSVLITQPEWADELLPDYDPANCTPVPGCDPECVCHDPLTETVEGMSSVVAPQDRTIDYWASTQVEVHGTPNTFYSVTPSLTECSRLAFDGLVNSRIMLDATGVGTFTIRSLGDLDGSIPPTDFEVCTFQVTDVGQGARQAGETYDEAVVIVEHTWTTRTLDMVVGFIGGDPQTAYGIGANVAGGILIIGDVGSMVKNGWRYLGFSSKPVNAVEVALTSLGLATELAVGVGEAPDSAISTVRAIVASLGRTKFTDALVFVFKRARSNATEMLNLGKMLKGMLTPTRLQVSRKVLTSQRALTSATKAVENFGEEILDDMVAVAIDGVNGGQRTAGAFIDVVGDPDNFDVLSQIVCYLPAATAQGGPVRAGDATTTRAVCQGWGEFSSHLSALLRHKVDSNLVKKIWNNEHLFTFPNLPNYGLKELARDMSELVTVDGVESLFKALKSQTDQVAGIVYELQYAAHMKRLGKNVQVLGEKVAKADTLTGTSIDVVIDSVYYQLKRSPAAFGSPGQALKKTKAWVRKVTKHAALNGTPIPVIKYVTPDPGLVPQSVKDYLAAKGIELVKFPLP